MHDGTMSVPDASGPASSRLSASSPDADPWLVAEMMGIEGPFTFSEKLLQKIWLRGNFDRDAVRTADGRSVKIVNPGRWNLLAGPDFRDAQLVIDGVAIQGDVELHINAGDWRQHGHAEDPAYDGVVLHVVLFPPGDAFTRGSRKLLPVVALLPLLRQDLEAYATEEAIEALAGRSVTELRMALAHGAPELAAGARLFQLAGERWRQKVYFARQRITRLGWEAACHHAALEVLGYRMNRPPMLAVATRFPLAQWRPASTAPEQVAEAAWESQREHWRHRGVRPANYPRQRLRQYAGWVYAAPDWPERLRSAHSDLKRLATLARQAMTVPDNGQGDAGQGRGAPDYLAVAAARRRIGARQVRSELANKLGADALGDGGTRLDTFFCDALFPLAAALEGEAERDGESVMQWLWHAWFPGDYPAEFATFINELGMASRASPVCHGMIQGMLGWLLQHNSGFHTGSK